jgi:aryl-alcohol dehydrogenase-like predicted oxidoreductase
MDYVPLGKSGLASSVIGLGGGSSGRFGLVKGGTKSDAIKLIHTALDLGITFFDAAGAAGGVDELLAEALGGRRNQVILSTKVHLGPPVPMPGSPFANRVSSWAARRAGLVCPAKTLRKRVERGLKALRTDRIDLLHLHAVTPAQYPKALERLVPELLKLKAAGKLRAIGITEGFLSDPGHRTLQAALADGAFDTVMVGFNPSNRNAAETVIPQAKASGVGTIGMFALRGLMSSAHADRAALPDLAYRYSRQAGIDLVLTGTGDAEHLQQNVAAVLGAPLSQEMLELLGG